MGGSSAIYQHHAGKRLYNSGECKMYVKHKWHKEIKAWADGAEIEMWYPQYDGWGACVNPSFDREGRYRIKPQPREWQWLGNNTIQELLENTDRDEKGICELIDKVQEISKQLNTKG